MLLYHSSFVHWLSGTRVCLYCRAVIHVLVEVIGLLMLSV